MNKIKLASLIISKIILTEDAEFSCSYLTWYKGSQIKQSQHIYQVISKSVCNLKAVTAPWTYLVPCFKWQKRGISLPKWMLIFPFFSPYFFYFPALKVLALRQDYLEGNFQEMVIAYSTNKTLGIRNCHLWLSWKLWLTQVSPKVSYTSYSVRWSRSTLCVLLWGINHTEFIWWTP